MLQLLLHVEVVCSESHGKGPQCAIAVVASAIAHEHHHRATRTRGQDVYGVLGPAVGARIVPLSEGGTYPCFGKVVASPEQTLLKVAVHSLNDIAPPHMLCACDHQSYRVANALILAASHGYGLYDQDPGSRVCPRYSYVWPLWAIYSYIEVHSSLRMFVGSPPKVGSRTHVCADTVRTLVVECGMFPFSVGLALLHVDRLSTWLWGASEQAARVFSHDTSQSVIVILRLVGGASARSGEQSRDEGRP